MLLFISATTSQCTKTSTNPDDLNVLPPETQTGAGTFACKINGVVWKYKDPDYRILNSSPMFQYTFNPDEKSGKLVVAGFRYTGNSTYDDGVGIYADSLLLFNSRETLAGKVSGISYGNNLILNDCALQTTVDTNDSSNNRFFNNSGRITITKLDNSNKIISGTFYCTLKRSSCDTVKITDGRFDFKY